MNTRAFRDEEWIPFEGDDEFKVNFRPEGPRVKFLDLRKPLSPLTPNEDFFVFHQTRTPQIDSEKWRLKVAGCVRNPREFTLAELLHMEPMRHVESIIECAGNQPISQKLSGQVSNARWSGIHLRSVLKRCGLRASAREVVFFGADAGREPSGELSGLHGRSVFVQDALDEQALLATRMNDEPLPPDHGFPMRVILPGWYGVAQIKWLTRIEVLDCRYEGPQMSRNYHSVRAIPTGDDPLLIETSISKTRLKSVVTRVMRNWHENVCRVEGAAWGGTTPIERVELRVDQGRWFSVKPGRRRAPHTWMLWSHDWKQPEPGRHSLVSRAIDVEGNVQPTISNWRADIHSERENNAQWERAIYIAAVENQSFSSGSEMFSGFAH